MKLFKNIAFLIILFSCQNLFAQLSGVYTIGGTTGATNFISWSSFVSTFNSGGVSGKTDVYVLSDLSEANIVSLDVPSSNPTNSTNTLTIHGNGYSIIGNGTSNNYEIMTLNGVDWMNIKGLKFKNTRTFNTGICLRITNESTDILIDSCVFEFSALTNTLAPTGAYIAASPLNTLLTSVSTTTQSALRTVISNCKFQTSGTGTPGPKYGIITTQLAVSNSNYKPTEVSIINNVMTNFYSYAIYSLNAMDDDYSGNNISRSNATSSTIVDTLVNVIYVTSSSIGKKQFEITKNYIHDLPYVGFSVGGSNLINTMNCIFIYACNSYVTGKSTANHRMIISENNISKCTTRLSFTGIYITSTSFPRVLKNKVNDNVVQYLNKSIYVNGGANCYINENELKGNMMSLNILNHCVGIYALNITDTVNVFKNVIDSNNSNCKVHMLNITLCSRVYMFGNVVTSNTLLNNNYEFISIINSRINYLRLVSNIVSNNQGGNNHFSLYFLNNTSGTYDHLYQQNTILYSAKNTVTKQWSWYLNSNHPATFTGNITVNTGTSSNYLVEAVNTTAKYIANGNIFYCKPLGYNWKLVTTVHTFLSNWQTAVNSTQEISVDPRFFNVSKHEYYPQHYLAQNAIATLTNFPEDAYGRPRAKTNSDYGALESYSDIQLKSVSVTPSTFCYNSVLTFKAKIKSYYSDTIKDLKIAFTVNNKKLLKIDQLFTINPLDTTICTFNTTGMTWYNGKNYLKVYIEIPNDSLANDTLLMVITCNKSPGSILKKITSTQLNSPYYYTNSNADVTILNLPWGYSIPAPSGYTNADYGNSGKWIASISAKTKGGKSVSYSTLTAPNGSVNAEWKLIVTDTLYQDSIFILDMVISDLINGCDTSYHKEVYIWPVPIQKVSFNHVICEEDLVDFKHVTTSKYGNNTYKWNFGTSPTDTSILNFPQKRYDTAGVFAVSRVLTNDQYKFKFMWYDTIIVNAKPVINLSNSPACEGKAFYISNKTEPRNSIMTYDFGFGLESISDTQFLKMYSTIGDKTFKAYADNKGCKYQVTQTIHVNYLPNAQFGVDGDFCLGNVLSFINSSSITDFSTLKYTWQLDSFTSSTLSNPTYKYANSGQKSVSLIAKSTTGCADTSIQFIEVLQNPIAKFNYTDLCELSETKFTSTSTNLSGNNTIYNWDLDKGITGTGNEIKQTWYQTGYRTIKLKVTLANGCKDSTSELIEILPLPIPKMQFKDSVCATDSIRFLNLSTNSLNNPMTYQWIFQNGDSTNIENPSYYFHQYGNTVNSYKVKLKVSVLYGCKNEIEKTITLKGAPNTIDFIAKPDYLKYYRGISLNPVDINGVEGGINGVEYKWFLQSKDTQRTSGVNAKIIYQVPIDASYWAHMWAKQTSNGCVSYSAKVAVINRVNNQDIENDPIQLYPNPASENLTLITSKLNVNQLNIRIFNSLGQTVFVQDINTKVFSKECTLNISKIPTGIYEICISGDGLNYSKKMNISR